MAKIAAYQSKLEISPDGKATWYEVCGLNSGEPSLTLNTEEVTTWCDDGNVVNEPTTKETTFSFDGYYEVGDVGQQLIESKFYASEKFAHFRFYDDKRDLDSYHEFGAFVVSLSKSRGVDDKIGFSFELNAKGEVQPINIFDSI